MPCNEPSGAVFYTMRHTIRVWCAENGADGTYTIEDPSRVNAIEKAVEEFQESCAMAATLYQPPRHRCQTCVIESKAVPQPSSAALPGTQKGEGC